MCSSSKPEHPYQVVGHARRRVINRAFWTGFLSGALIAVIGGLYVMALVYP